MDFIAIFKRLMYYMLQLLNANVSMSQLKQRSAVSVGCLTVFSRRTMPRRSLLNQLFVANPPFATIPGEVGLLYNHRQKVVR